jgi:hypothetical protein
MSGTMDKNKIKDFRKNAEQYGCSEDEIQYTEQILSQYNTNIVFTFEQFKVFCEYWRQYLGVVPFGKYFFLYPKDNGLRLGQYDAPTVHMTVLALSTTLYKPMVCPGFIEKLDQYWNFIKDSHGDLVVLSDDNKELSTGQRGGWLSTFKGARIPCDIGGGGVYYDSAAKSMGSIEKMYQGSLLFCIKTIYNPKERYLIYGKIEKSI